MKLTYLSNRMARMYANSVKKSGDDMVVSYANGNQSTLSNTPENNQKILNDNETVISNYSKKKNFIFASLGWLTFASSVAGFVTLSMAILLSIVPIEPYMLVLAWVPILLDKLSSFKNAINDSINVTKGKYFLEHKEGINEGAKKVCDEHFVIHRKKRYNRIVNTIKKSENEDLDILNIENLQYGDLKMLNNINDDTPGISYVKRAKH